MVVDEGMNAPERGLELRMLCEQFVEGEEFSVEMLVQGGRGVFSNVTGKLLYPGPRPVEMGHVVPADIAPELAALLAAQTQAVVDAVDFRDGMVHCEWIVSDGVPYIVECAGRPAGDGIVDMIRQAYPVDINQAFFDIMAGREISVELPAQAKGAASIRFIDVAEPGIVTAIRGVEQAQAGEGVFYADSIGRRRRRGRPRSGARWTGRGSPPSPPRRRPRRCGWPLWRRPSSSWRRGL